MGAIAKLFCPRCRQATTERTSTGNGFCRPCDGLIFASDRTVKFTQAELSAALAAVQQETQAECAKWMQHLHGCDSLIKSIYIERNEQGERITHLEQHAGDPMTPANKCSCGLSEHLKAQSAPKAPRPEATRSRAPHYSAEQLEEIAVQIRQHLAEGAEAWAKMTRVEQAEALLHQVEWEIKIQGWMLHNRAVEELLQAIETFNAATSRE